MAMTIDHRRVDHIVHVLQGFTDARGVAHQVGERGLIVDLAYNKIRSEIRAADWVFINLDRQLDQ